MMTAAARQPVSIAVEADQSGWQFYSGGVFGGTCGTKLDHGVLVVGYGTQGSSPYYIVKNSWGASGGMAGLHPAGQPGHRRRPVRHVPGRLHADGRVSG